MTKRRTQFDPAKCAVKLREAAADLRRLAPSSSPQVMGLAASLERRATAILRPDIIADLEELMAVRFERRARA